MEKLGESNTIKLRTEENVDEKSNELFSPFAATNSLAYVTMRKKNARVLRKYESAANPSGGSGLDAKDGQEELDTTHANVPADDVSHTAPYSGTMHTTIVDGQVRVSSMEGSNVKASSDNVVPTDSLPVGSSVGALGKGSTGATSIKSNHGFIELLFSVSLK